MTTKRRYRKYTKEYVELIVKNSVSISDCLRKMDRIPHGGNYKFIHNLLTKYEIDTSHFLGKSHNKEKELKLYEDLSKSESIKRRVLKERGHKCEECNNTTWLNKPIPLELEHVDGNNRNNHKDNLKLLCCNCHALTPTWRRPK